MHLLVFYSLYENAWFELQKKKILSRYLSRVTKEKHDSYYNRTGYEQMISQV
jgi:hypothetical protein